MWKVATALTAIVPFGLPILVVALAFRGAFILWKKHRQAN